MIRLDVKPYCHDCDLFDPDVERPQKMYNNGAPILVGDTIIRCGHRKLCKNLKTFLEKEEPIMFYTSYFAKLKKLPADVIPISICGKAPEWYTGLKYKKLAPKYHFFMEWKRTHDNAYYIERFEQEVLAALDPAAVFEELSALSSGQTFALICYEHPREFCHRHLVADWFCKNGYRCEEIEV